MINYYKILGVSKSASVEEIKEAYRKKALRVHPDVNDSPKAHTKFQEINEAYITLNDPVNREKYDMVLEYGFERIADAIKREKATLRRQGYGVSETKHRDPAYSPKSEEFVAEFMERKNRPVKKDMQIIMLENLLFASMVFIGVAFFAFAYMDMMSERRIEKLHGIAGLITSIIFLVLLAMGWKMVLGRKFKL